MKTKAPTKTEVRTRYAAIVEAERARTAPQITNPELLAIYNAKLDALKDSLFPTPMRMQMKLAAVIKPIVDLYHGCQEGKFTEAERELVLESWTCIDLAASSEEVQQARQKRNQREYLTGLDPDRFFKT